MPEVLLVVSIDTEEDNWYRSRRDVTCTNITALPRLALLFQRLGVRPTYFITHHVATNSEAVALLREVAARPAAEIAAHLHPWNTPPVTEPFTRRNSMLKNLPAGLQAAKLQSLTAAIASAFGTTPRSFRAGRYGLGRDTVATLLSFGYQVDSSVTPSVSWEAYDDGPTFIDAPLEVYRLASDRDVTQPAEDGELIEVPLSSGFSRAAFSVCERLSRGLHVPGLRRLRGFCKPIVLSPEGASVSQMLGLARRLLARGVRHLHLSWHSPSLKPGLSPFTTTEADVSRLYARVEEFVGRLSKISPFRFVTVSEAAALLGHPLLPKATAC